jgi:hypothetical protein
VLWDRQGIAGETLWFYIYPRDQHGNRRDDSDDVLMAQEGRQFEAVATLKNNVGQGYGSTTLTASIEYQPDRHVFLVQYTPTISGVWSLNVTFQDWRFFPRLPVTGSPFLVTVDEARSFGPTSLAVGAGLSQGMAGVEQNFTIFMRDAMNNIRHVGADAIDVMAYHVDGRYVAYGDVTVRTHVVT